MGSAQMGLATFAFGRVSFVVVVGSALGSPPPLPWVTLGGVPGSWLRSGRLTWLRKRDLKFRLLHPQVGR
jgi:hypothetical protein